MPALIPALTARLRIFVVFCLFIAAFTAGSFAILHLAFSPAPGLREGGITSMALIMGLCGGTLGWGIASAPRRLPELPKWLQIPKKVAYVFLSMCIFFGLGFILNWQAPIIRAVFGVIGTFIVLAMMDHRASTLAMNEYRLRALESAERLTVSLRAYNERVSFSQNGKSIILPFLNAMRHYTEWKGYFPNPLFKVQLLAQLDHLKSLYDADPDYFSLPGGEAIQNAILRLLKARRNTFEADELMIDAYIDQINAVKF